MAQNYTCCISTAVSSQTAPVAYHATPSRNIGAVGLALSERYRRRHWGQRTHSGPWQNPGFLHAAPACARASCARCLARVRGQRMACPVLPDPAETPACPAPRPAQMPLSRPRAHVRSCRTSMQICPSCPRPKARTPRNGRYSVQYIPVPAPGRACGGACAFLACPLRPYAAAAPAPVPAP